MYQTQLHKQHSTTTHEETTPDAPQTEHAAEVSADADVLVAEIDAALESESEQSQNQRGHYTPCGQWVSD